MKALTIKQPWASLIVAGIKDVENRSWPTNYRGPLLIHAGKSRDPIPPGVLELFMADARAIAADPELPAGEIIGRVDLVACIRDSSSEWAQPGAFHFMLENARPVEHVPARGRLALWEHGNPAQLSMFAAGALPAIG